MARAAHVNLMTDTVIANLSPDALRAVVRALLADDRDGLLARRFQHHARQRLRRDCDCDCDRDLLALPDADDPVAAVLLRRRRILALLGCGLAVDSLALIADIVTHAALLLRRRRRQHDHKNDDDDDDDEFPLLGTLAAVDADLVQALTAVRTQQQQQQQHPSHAQTMAALRDLQHCLAASHAAHRAQHCEFAFERGQDMLRELLEEAAGEEEEKKQDGGTDGLRETI
ncbi:hypothetical protein LOZ65_006059 [Ophidiomyces ophidiicola]|nr:hypothetical protein LOZ65_006059 [Ophidiomyces ophidiicola]